MPEQFFSILKHSSSIERAPLAETVPLGTRHLKAEIPILVRRRCINQRRSPLYWTSSLASTFENLLCQRRQPHVHSAMREQPFPSIRSQVVLAGGDDDPFTEGETHWAVRPARLGQSTFLELSASLSGATPIQSNSHTPAVSLRPADMPTTFRGLDYAPTCRPHV